MPGGPEIVALKSGPAIQSLTSTTKLLIDQTENQSAGHSGMASATSATVIRVAKRKDTPAICAKMATSGPDRLGTCGLDLLAGARGFDVETRAKIPHGPDPLRKDQVGPGGLLGPSGYGN